jgi:SnoaL-like polyketide cyclase
MTRTITDATRTGIRAVLADAGPRRQSMPGFDADYHDIVHYILRCTYRIWEQRGIELINTHYAPDARVVTLAGETRTAQAVIDGTRAMLASFPDRRLAGEDVIWCRLPNAQGLFSSHRLRSRMTHRGASEFGAATGRVARFRTIADCYVRANRIYLEWLVRDNLAIAQQLGVDPFRLAARLAQLDAPDSKRRRRRTAQAILANQRWASEAPTHARVPNDISAWVTARTAALNARRWDRFEGLHAPSLIATLPGERQARSPRGVAAYWDELISAMPDLRVVTDRVTALRVSPREQRIAVRWWAAGTHSGGGRFGRASGAIVLLLGVSQFRVDADVVTREWTVTDELAILRQIAAAQTT